MKRILLISILLLIATITFGQFSPVPTGNSTSITANKGAGSFDSGVVTGNYIDTTKAQRIKAYKGAIIATGDSLWLRSVNKWVLLNPTGSGTGTVTSVGLTMPSAFTVSNSPITISGNIGVTANGTTSEYIRGNGTLQTFPTIPTTTNLIDSIRRVGLQVSAQKNGSWINQFLLPDSVSSGTYVPYVGATTNVNLGTHKLTSDSIVIPPLATSDTNIVAGFDLNGKLVWRTKSSGGSSSAWSLTGDAGTTSANFIGTTDAQPLVFKTDSVERMRILDNGNIGIGKNNPDYLIDAIGSSHDYVMKVENTETSEGYAIYGKSSGLGIGILGSSVNSDGVNGITTNGIGVSGYSSNGIAGYFQANNTSGKGISVMSYGQIASFTSISPLSNQYHIVFDSIGQVGIGTTTPTATLDIDGSIRFRTGGTAGYVLTSDANGNATWQMGGGSIDTTNFANIWLSNTFQANQIINGGDGDEPITLGSLDGDNYGLWNMSSKRIATYNSVGNIYSYAADNIVYDANAGSLTLNNNIYLQNVSASTYTGKSIVLIDGTSSNKLSSITVDSFALASKVKADSSTIMTAVNLKAPIASPTFTGTVTMPTPFTLGATSVTTTAAQLNYLNTASSNIQTQLNTKLEDEDKTKTYQALGSGILAENPFVDQTQGGTSNTFTDGRCYFSPVYLSKAATITGVKWLQRTTGSYTGDNENRIGLYSYSGGTMTLVASCANDATLWSTVGTSTFGSKAFSGTYSAAAGLYFVGALYNSSAQTTAPTVGGSTITVAAQSTLDFTNSAKISSYVATTTLPSSQAMSGTTSTTLLFNFSIY